MKRRIRHLFIRSVLLLFFAIGRIFNKNQLSFIAKVLGAFFYILPTGIKSKTLKSLQSAFGEVYNQVDIKVILKNLFNEFFLNALLIAHIATRRPPIQNWVEVEGLEHLEKALSKGNGVVAVSGHFGNFILMIACLSAKGYPVAALYNEWRYYPQNPLYGILISTYKVHSIPLTPDKFVISDVIKALNMGMIVFILSDQIKQGVQAKFFGHSISCTKGPYVIAKRKGSPIVPMFIVREEETYKILIYPEIDCGSEVNFSKNADECIIRLVERFNSILEDLVRRYPFQYFYFHRRFKNL